MTPKADNADNVTGPLWIDQLATWKTALLAKGARISSYDIGPPASAEELAALPRASGRAVPAGLAAVLAFVSGRADFFWQLEHGQHNTAVPTSLARFGQIGELAFNVQTMVWLRAEGEVIPDDKDLEPAQAALVRASLEFHRTNVGDILAVDSRNGAVNYLTYESGFGEATLLAPSFAAFLERFTSIGCVGPEMWVLEQILGPTGIDPDAEIARQWRAWAGVGPWS